MAGEFDRAKARAFTQLMVRHLEGAAVSLMLEVGRRVGLFDAMAQMGAVTSAEIAEKAGLDERYVREWLAAMVCGGVVEYAADAHTYRLPREHASALTGSSTRNLTSMVEMFPLLNRVIPDVAEAFRTGRVCRTARSSPISPVSWTGEAGRATTSSCSARISGSPRAHRAARGRHSGRRRGLRHRALHHADGAPVSEERVRRIRHLREWDRRGPRGRRRARQRVVRGAGRREARKRPPRSISSPRSTRSTIKPIPPVCSGGSAPR